jgi:hypothetical protein
MQSPRILVCYSNPTDKQLLRLDIEHSQLEAAIRESGSDSSILKRIHATRTEDLVAEITAAEYHILQFSGHGDEDGIFLENPNRNGSVLLDINSLKEILLIAPKSLRIVILTCCYSASYRDDLAPHVPYLISVTGLANDAAAIQFSKFFFSFYLRDQRSIEDAVRYATTILGKNSNFSIEICRRGLLNHRGNLIVESRIDKEIILVNLNNVRDFIDSLSEQEQDQFLDAIRTSIRAHFNLFCSAMERVAIPFGKYVGVFTWQNEFDQIVCNQVFIVNENITEMQFEAVARLMLRYTNLARLSYRERSERDYPNKARVVKESLNNFHFSANMFLASEYAAVFKELSPSSYKVAIGIIRANLAEADLSISQEDYSQTIIHMEMTLTTFHNFVLQILKEIEG